MIPGDTNRDTAPENNKEVHARDDDQVSHSQSFSQTVNQTHSQHRQLNQPFLQSPEDIRDDGPMVKEIFQEKRFDLDSSPALLQNRAGGQPIPAHNWIVICDDYRIRRECVEDDGVVCDSTGLLRRTKDTQPGLQDFLHPCTDRCECLNLETGKFSVRGFILFAISPLAAAAKGSH